MTLNLEGQLWNVVEFQHVKPGKGPAFVRTKLKNVMSGKVVDKTFNAGIKVDVAHVDNREMQHLYREGGDFVFMETSDSAAPRIPARDARGRRYRPGPAVHHHRREDQGRHPDRRLPRPRLGGCAQQGTQAGA